LTAVCDIDQDFRAAPAYLDKRTYQSVPPTKEIAMSRPIVLAVMLFTLALVSGCTRSDAAIAAAAPAGMPASNPVSAADAVQQAIDNLAAWPEAGSR
jgi:hypothetical protein